MIKVSSRRIFQYWQLPGKMLEGEKEGLTLKRNYQENKRKKTNLFFLMRENLITLTTKFLNIAPSGRNAHSSRKHFIDLSFRGKEGRAVFQPEKEQSINTVHAHPKSFSAYGNDHIRSAAIFSLARSTESCQGYLFL